MSFWIERTGWDSSIGAASRPALCQWQEQAAATVVKRAYRTAMRSIMFQRYSDSEGNADFGAPATNLALARRHESGLE